MNLAWGIFEGINITVQAYIMLSCLLKSLSAEFNEKNHKRGFLISLAAGIIYGIFIYAMQSPNRIVLLCTLIFSCIYIFIGFKEEIIKKLFVCVLGSVLIIFTHVAFSILFFLLLKEDILHISNSCLTGLFYFICTDIFFFLAAGKILRIKCPEFIIRKESMYFISAEAFISVIIILYFTEEIFFNKYHIAIHYLLIAITGLMLLNLTNIYFFIRFGKNEIFSQKYEALCLEREYQIEKINDISHLYQEVSKVRHDLKNYMAIAISYLNVGKIEAAKEYIQELHDTKIETLRRADICDNERMNHLMNYKLNICEVQGIKCQVTIENSIKYIPSNDVSILMANLLDNAIEACEYVTDKYIKVNIKKENDNLWITVKNHIENSVLEQNESLITTKKDKKQHGLGIKSIKDVVAKYQGSLKYYEEEQEFCCKISLKIDNRF